MSTETEMYGFASLTKVEIKGMQGEIKIEEHSPVGLLITVVNGSGAWGGNVVLDHNQTLSLLGALNTISQKRFSIEYARLKAIIKEKDCNIANITTLKTAQDSNVKSMNNTIRELREIIREKERSIDELKQVIDINEEFEANQNGIIEARGLRINEYKKELEKAHAQINILRQQKDSKPNKWKKKFKALKKDAEENTRDMEMQIIGCEGTVAGKESLIKSMNVQLGDMSTNMKNLESDRNDLMNENHRLKSDLRESNKVIKCKDSLIEGLRSQRKDADDKIAELERHNNILTKSDFVIYKGRQIESEFLREVALERLNQLDKGRTIEKDVLNNRKGQLIEAALYCIAPRHLPYPEDWNTDFKDNLKKKGRFPKLICSAALIIAHMDMKKYIYDQNRKFEKLQKGE